MGADRASRFRNFPGLCALTIALLFGESDVNAFRLFAASAMALAAVPLAAATTGSFSPARLSNHIKIIGSDSYEGRAPATRAETKTIDYIVGQFKAAGLQPGGDPAGASRKWTQDVPLLKSDIVGTPQLALNLGNGTTVNLTQG